MSLPRTSAKDHDREARERIESRRRVSIRLGSAGIILLFVAGAGILVSPETVSALLFVMVLGLILVVAAFLMIRDVGGGLLKLRELTKML